MNNKDNIRLTIITPQETIFEGLVEKVELPGDKGRFMVLKNHAPVISSLSQGSIVYVSDGELTRVAIRDGFVRVNNNEVVVCAER
ncbi:MAG: ATP synthase F1 subunit epsilon [Bacteroidales bacterium]|nr:ATP synthase F1 subunit epsilon [Bacteroidales bacterium]